MKCQFGQFILEGTPEEFYKFIQLMKSKEPLVSWYDSNTEIKKWDIGVVDAQKMG
jgi:hypothetical protein